MDVSPIAQVGRVGRLGGESQHALHERLGALRTHEEELDDGGEGLQLHLDRLLAVVLEERANQLVGVVDLVGVLAQDPDQRRLGLGLVELFERGAQRRDDALVPLRVLAEDVL